MQGNNANNIGVILLAAGSSTRLGRPKQLLSYHGHTLLQYSLQVALAARVQQAVIILGANAEILQSEVKGINVHTVINHDWPEGIASSIRCGISTISEIAPAIDGIILMVCDQPFITADILNELITAHQQTSKQIVACGYDNTFGPPVFFHQSLFGELLQLKGDTGAKALVRQHAGNVAIVPFPAGTFDIDTESDYEVLKK